MHNKLLPHFLIVGAPKCGTTALHYYLSQHPEVNMSPKEIHYFGNDLGYKVERPTLDYYQSFFKEQGINGDGSVWYLYSDTIFKELKALNITPKIIVMLRNPTEVCYAMHSQNIIDANEDIYEFESALGLEESRKNGNNIPINTDPNRALFYKEMGRFLPRIRFFQENIKASDLFIGLQEDLKSNTVQFLIEIEKFLQLTPFEKYDLSRVNSNKVVANNSLHNTIKHPGSLKIKLFRTLLPYKPLRKWLVEKVYNQNIKEEKRIPIKSNTKNILDQYFKNENIELSKIITSDISSWVNPK